MDTASRSVSPLRFFLCDTPTTSPYSLSLHDALPISNHYDHVFVGPGNTTGASGTGNYLISGSPSGSSIFLGNVNLVITDRKSTRLNSSHANISYAVFCLKKKVTKQITASAC